MSLKRTQKERELNQIWYGDQSPPIHYYLLSGVFALFAWIRRLMFKLGIRKVETLSVPVIVVGNIHVGGTGKTPFVFWLWQQLSLKGYKVGVISRGTGRKKAQLVEVQPDSLISETGDEPLLLRQRGVKPIYVGSDRPLAAQKLLNEHEVDFLIADDGLQHYALGRQMEIVLLDGLRGFRNKHLLPRGPLREPARRLKHVDHVIVNSAHLPDVVSQLMTLRAEALYQINQPEIKVSLDQLQNQPVHAVAGIGHPERFFISLERLGFTIIRHAFSDHHPFSAEDLVFDDKQPIIMTEKDAVKCASFASDQVYALPIFASMSAAFTDCLMEEIFQLTVDAQKKVFF